MNWTSLIIGVAIGVVAYAWIYSILLHYGLSGKRATRDVIHRLGPDAFRDLAELVDAERQRRKSL